MDILQVSAGAFESAGGERSYTEIQNIRALHFLCRLCLPIIFVSVAKIEQNRDTINRIWLMKDLLLTHSGRQITIAQSKTPHKGKTCSALHQSIHVP